MTETVRATGRDTRIPISILFDGEGTFADPGWRTSVGSAIELSTTVDELTARVGFAIEQVALVDAIIPPASILLDRYLSPGFLRSGLDEDNDGRISEQEVRDSDTIKSLLAADVEIDGVPAMSLGIQVTATRVTN